MSTNCAARPRSHPGNPPGGDACGWSTCSSLCPCRLTAGAGCFCQGSRRHLQLVVRTVTQTGRSHRHTDLDGQQTCIPLLSLLRLELSPIHYSPSPGRTRPPKVRWYSTLPEGYQACIGYQACGLNSHAQTVRCVDFDFVTNDIYYGMGRSRQKPPTNLKGCIISQPVENPHSSAPTQPAFRWCVTPPHACLVPLHACLVPLTCP